MGLGHKVGMKGKERQDWHNFRCHTECFRPQVWKKGSCVPEAEGRVRMLY